MIPFVPAPHRVVGVIPPERALLVGAKFGGAGLGQGS
ncbi:unnamed protein product [Plutella xylostella]|uniref:(diamondback moth) hypothetical protein n=1 Tax=Plutella xylostella TaxID=51655 RepID=A0A8S4DBI0_PLUXY|nr:unnamed protein product [Plutella xylostella]